MARARGDISRQATAGARYLHISPTKLNQVAALIRGAHVDEARRILAFTPKEASRELSKVLESAIANAENNFQLASDELYVLEIRCDEGPTMKRFRPRAQGRAYRIRKRTAHLHITVERRAPEAPLARSADQAAKGSRLLRRRGPRGTGSGSAGGGPQAKSTKAGKGDQRGS